MPFCGGQGTGQAEGRAFPGYPRGRACGRRHRAVDRAGQAGREPVGKGDEVERSRHGNAAEDEASGSGHRGLCEVGRDGGARPADRCEGKRKTRNRHHTRARVPLVHAPGTGVSAGCEECGMGAFPGGPFHSCKAGRGGRDTLRSGEPRETRPPGILRSHGAASVAGGIGCISQGPVARRVREARGQAPREPPIWRTLGTPLAGCCALCGKRRI